MKWKFYLSGILYGEVMVEDGCVMHRPYDVFAGSLSEWCELEDSDTWYYELGRMNVKEAMLRLPDYEKEIKSGKNRFETVYGEVFEKRDNTSYIERVRKFPKDLFIENGEVIAIVTPYRDQCALLVKEGFEDRTILKQWKEEMDASLYKVKHPETFMVSMRDGVCLATDVYLPCVEGTVPAVLVRTPYGKLDGAVNYYRYVQRGYAVVIQDVRGREDSEGEWIPHNYEVEDGDDTLNWIADQEWSDGSVGMTGGSYLGYVQWAAAASENPHLKAILSSVTAGGPFVDLPRHGGCFDSGMLAWAFMVSEQRLREDLANRDDWDQVLDIRPLENLAKEALGHDVPFLTQWFRHMDNDEFWKKGSWKERTKKCYVPALIMSGWFDDNGMGTTEALDLYKDFNEKKVILGPWKHSGNANYDIHGFTLGMNALRYDMDLICFKWIDHYLKGVENGIENTPKVEYYTMGSNEWKTEENWPIKKGEEYILYLDGTVDAAVTNQGTLSEMLPSGACSDSYIYDPEHPATHIIDMSENEISVPEDYKDEELRSDILCYSTDVLKEDITITGDMRVKLYLSSDCEDTDLVVRITDADSDGHSWKLADGVRCMRYRNQFEYGEFMEPDVVYPVEIRTSKISHTFKKGHRIRLTVTSSAKNMIFPNRNTRGGYNSVEMKIAHNKIHRGGRYDSKVIFTREG